MDGGGGGAKNAPQIYYVQNVAKSVKVKSCFTEHIKLNLILS